MTITHITSDFFPRPCSSCGRTPKVNLSTEPNILGSWLWDIGCDTRNCHGSFMARNTVIHVNEQRNFGIQLEKINEIVTRWNHGITEQAKEVTIVHFYISGV